MLEKGDYQGSYWESWGEDYENNNELLVNSDSPLFLPA